MEEGVLLRGPSRTGNPKCLLSQLAPAPGLCVWVPRSEVGLREAELESWGQGWFQSSLGRQCLTGGVGELSPRSHWGKL